ncbi:hypothetical protein [Streptomyces sp. NPDC005017]|uniref:hypothetical protein n=1 Tax=Streptomyces sp. NPDC005017 TaxID=3364706 RepID=UPI00367BED4B
MRRRNIILLLFLLLISLIPAPTAHAWGRERAVPPSGGVESSGIVSLSRRPSQLDLFWIRSDGAVATAYWSDGRQVWDPQLVAPPGSASVGALSGGLAAVSRNPGHLDVFWVRPDGGVSSNWWNAASRRWARPFPIAGARSALPGTLAAVSRNPDQLDVFWIGPDRAIGTTAWNPSHGWLRPWPITAPAAARHPAGALSVISRVRDQLDLFWVRPDGGVSTAWWNPRANWPSRSIAPAGHVLVGDRTTPRRAALTVVSRSADQLDVFWIGPDGAIGTTAWNPRLNWPAPWPITAPGAAQPGALAAVARTRTRLEVAWISPGDRLHTLSLDDHVPGGWSGSPATAAGSALPGAVSLISRRPGHMDAFWVRPDRRVGTDTWDTEHFRVHVLMVNRPASDDTVFRAKLADVTSLYGNVEVIVDTVTFRHLELRDTETESEIKTVDVGMCDERYPLTTDQTELFSHRPDVPDTDAVLYVVGSLPSKSTTGTTLGCARHRPGKPEAIVAADVSWGGVAHELGHLLLGSGHENDFDNLMSGSESLRKVPPDILSRQKTSMYTSNLTNP